MKRRPGSSVDSLDATEKVRSHRVEEARVGLARARDREAVAAVVHEQRAADEQAHENHVRAVETTERMRLASGAARAADLQALASFRVASDERSTELAQLRDDALKVRDAAEAARQTAHENLVASEVDRKVIETHRSKLDAQLRRERDNDADEEILDSFQQKAR